MIRLLKYNFTRVRKSKFFWLGCVGVFLAAVIGILYMYYYYCKIPSKIKDNYMTLSQQQYKEKLDNYRIDTVSRILYFFSPIVIGILSVVCPLTVGADITFKTIRNQVVAGKSRSKIYVANVLTSIVIGISYCLVWIIVMVTLGASLLYVGDTFENVVRGCGLGILQVIVFSVIFTMIIMIFKSFLIVCIVCVVATSTMLLEYYIVYEAYNNASRKQLVQEYGKKEFLRDKKLINNKIRCMKYIINSGLLEKKEISEAESVLKDYKEFDRTQYSSFDVFLENVYCYNEKDYIEVSDEIILKSHQNLYTVLLKCNPFHYFLNLGINISKEDRVYYTYDGKRHEENDWNDDVENDNSEDELVIPSEFVTDDVNVIMSQARIEQINNTLKKDKTYMKMFKKCDDSDIETEKKVKEKIYNKKYCSVVEMMLYDLLWIVATFMMGYVIFLKKNIT